MTLCKQAPCPSCGKNIVWGATVCRHCGELLAGDTNMITIQRGGGHFVFGQPRQILGDLGSRVLLILSQSEEISSGLARTILFSEVPVQLTKALYRVLGASRSCKAEFFVNELCHGTVLFSEGRYTLVFDGGKELPFIKFVLARDEVERLAHRLEILPRPIA